MRQARIAALERLSLLICKAGILPDAIKGRTGDEVEIPTNVKPQRLRVGNRWGLGIVVRAC